MAGRNKGTVPETEAERALAEIARQRFADFQSRWLPLQAEAASRLRSMAQPDSFERRTAQGIFGAETARAFTQAERGIEAREWAGGINPASGRAKLRAAGMQADRAAATGIGFSRANQIIEDAYVRGMQALMASGRGQQASAASALGNVGVLAQQAAASDAAAAAANRATGYDLAGTGIGFAGMALRRPRTSSEPPGPSNVFEWGYPDTGR